MCPPGDYVCEHLEKELQKLIPNQSVHGKSVSYIDSFRKTDIAEDREVQGLEMLAKLKQYALPDIYVSVLVLRFVQQLSFAEIADELSIPHKLIAFQIYKTALDRLKERGYK